ncbi:hypothetical protein [Microcoleus sp. bin38.metabat.b11b12b14.051]|uniref:hypothetical protein n=1 Tax=Microcoleus sp. bin38.metabat.b11b12b14.051 TaxID=2742709 RepID=UPI0025D36AA3|nr:hypothetical protein [Microcoleus sp. bin38.metabat.b11b12b14.051]
MDYLFTPATQDRLNTGSLVQPATKTGKLLPAARDPVTGEFVEIAKIFYPSTTATLSHRGVLGLLAQLAGGGPLQPLVVPAYVTAAPLQLAQTHQGFQKIYRMLNCLKINLAVMQATAAVIGIGAVSNTVLSAVNLDQVLKMREEAKHQKLKIKDGFIDLRHILKDRGVEVIQQIFKVAHNSNFEMYRQKLVNGYDIFSKAIKRCQSALTLPDIKLRNSEINSGRDMLFEALKIYDNPGLLEGLCCAAQLRQRECVWAIELAIGITFQLQRAYNMVSSRLLELQSKIRQDILTVVKGCQSQSELDFLFPEVTRILGHDLSVIEFWQNEVDWMQTLSAKDQHQLASLDKLSGEHLKTSIHTTFAVLAAEPSLYESLKQKSHFLSLRDQLAFAVGPELRRGHESYVCQQAIATGYPALATSNWEAISDLTVTNLYYFFQIRDNSTEDFAVEEEIETPDWHFPKSLEHELNYCN